MRLAAGLVTALIGGGCLDLAAVGTPPPAPDRASFPTVADALQVSCGTLDCHGQLGRNLRLFGGRGLRLDPRANPGDGATTTAEYDASYRSLVGLEPELLGTVLAEGGAAPERLTLIRKPRGEERHHGGQQMRLGDPLDVCLVSWLEGRADQASCKRVTDARPPGL